ncbi:MAG: MFS transporter [Actinomycetota bacterium]
MYPELARRFLRWTLLRDALARGWWLVTALYLVLVAELTAPQLILIGVFQGITVLVAEVPAGVLADAVSRRLTLVVAHIVMGIGMTTVAFTQSFTLLVVANSLWGLGWALTSGADVAWITDELQRPDLIDAVLSAQGRARLYGAVTGIIVFGVLGSVTTVAFAAAVGGISMVALGLATVRRWPETGFTPVASGERIAMSWLILRNGVHLAVRDRVIIAVLVATFLVNGAAEGFGRLYELRLIDLGVPDEPDPVLWFAAIAVVAAVFGAIALRIVEARIDGRGVVRRLYVAACAVGTVGLILFAFAPSAALAVVGALLVSGLSFPIIRVLGTIAVNRRTASQTRATVHSQLSQAENLGEVVLGVVIASVATGSPVTVLVVSASLVASAGLIAGSRLGHD